MDMFFGRSLFWPLEHLVNTITINSSDWQLQSPPISVNDHFRNGVFNLITRIMIYSLKLLLNIFGVGTRNVNSVTSEIITPLINGQSTICVNFQCLDPNLLETWRGAHNQWLI